MNRVLVTGANGFFGRHLVSHLLERGYDVIAGARNKETLVKIFPKVISLNILNQEEFQHISYPVDVIIHAAAQRLGPEQDPHSIRSLFNTNVFGTLNVLHYALALGIKKVIYCSSLCVYTLPQQLPISEEGRTSPLGNLDSYYGISKLTGELLLEQIRCDKKLHVTSLRLGRIYGPGDNSGGLLTEWKSKAEQGETIDVYGNGERSLDFIYIEDVVEGIESILKEEGMDGVMNLSSGVETTWKTLAQTFVEVFSRPERPSLLNYVSTGNKTRCYLDNSKIRKASGFIPRYSLKEGFLAWKENLKKS
ncbi:MAG: NAD(P)-dependent oxidoreductase [Deltaproteobacteria bacterium]|nr:NAD(P)-dependent oxidoreductase [Deltaproteobacteria bacterium]